MMLPMCEQCSKLLCGLTRRQLEILGYMAENPGATNYELAQQVGLSEGTVKKHLSAIYRAMGVQNRSQCLMSLVSAGEV
jgi:DNA-binding NarL/FixJ family response regulator